MIKLNKEKLISLRRMLHKNAEVGFDLPLTRSIVKENLDRLNLKYFENKGGIYGIINSPKCSKDNYTLLRADMDGLPMRELTDLEFKSQSECAHTCGHDIHTTALLGSLEYITENLDKLNKNIVFLFQSNEEGGKGAMEALKGIEKEIGFEKINEAFAQHVNAKSPLGTINYGYGQTFASNDTFEVTITGIGGHAARPFETKDPLNAAAHIVCMMYAMMQRESNPFEHNLFSITSIVNNETTNIIPDSVKILGSLRTYNRDQRNYLIKRLEEVAMGTAVTFSVKSEFKLTNSIPEVVTDKEFTDEVLEGIKKLEKYNVNVGEVKLGSEDFAYISEKFPRCAYIFLGAGIDETRGLEVGQHNPKVVFNEEAIFIGINCILSLVCN